MPRASKTGVRGLRKAPDGYYWIDIRERLPSGEMVRHAERLPKGTAESTATIRAVFVLNSILSGTYGEKPVAASASATGDVKRVLAALCTPHGKRVLRAAILEALPDFFREDG